MGWVPTGLSVAANLHRAVAHDNVPLIEYRVPDAGTDGLLRSGLAGPEPAIRDGEFELPGDPGLGVRVDLELVERLRVS